MSSSIFWKLHFLDPPSHIQQHKQIDIMFRITNSTLMDRKYPNALAYIKIEAVIRVKQKLWEVKIWAKMIWKQPSSFKRTSYEFSADMLFVNLPHMLKIMFNNCLFVETNILLIYIITSLYTQHSNCIRNLSVLI